MTSQHLVNGFQREEAGGELTQLMLDPARAELSFSAQRQDPALLLRKDVLVGILVWTTTPRR